MSWIVPALTLAAAAITWLGARDDTRWFEHLTRPRWVPGRPALATIVAARLVVVGVAGWWIVEGAGWGLTAGLWVTQLVLSMGSPWLLLRRHRPSAAFTWLCLDWVALGLAAAAARVFVPAAGWALLAVLPAVTWLGAATFFLWQLNPSLRGTPPGLDTPAPPRGGSAGE